MSICGIRDVECTFLGNVTEKSSPETCAFTTESINAVHTGSPIQTGVAQTLIDVFCTVDTSPARFTLTDITRDCFLRKEETPCHRMQRQTVIMTQPQCIFSVTCTHVAVCFSTWKKQRKNKINTKFRIVVTSPEVEYNKGIEHIDRFSDTTML